MSVCVCVRPLPIYRNLWVCEDTDAVWILDSLTCSVYVSVYQVSQESKYLSDNITTQLSGSLLFWWFNFYTSVFLSLPPSFLPTPAPPHPLLSLAQCV